VGVDVEERARAELMCRAVTTGAAPQELVDMVRQGMDPQDQGATDGQSLLSTSVTELTSRGDSKGIESSRFDENARRSESTR
jgi:hypothetical protein